MIYGYNMVQLISLSIQLELRERCTVEPRYNEVLGTIKITLLYQVSHIRVNNKRSIKRWDHAAN